MCLDGTKYGLRALATEFYLFAKVSKGSLRRKEVMATERTPEQRNTADYLSNERTFSAWIRTSIAVMGLGFIVAKFGFWIHELALRSNLQVPNQTIGMALPTGIGIIIFGGFLALLAAIRYVQVNQAISQGKFPLSPGIVSIMTIGVIIIMVVMVTDVILASAYTR